MIGFAVGLLSVWGVWSAFVIGRVLLSARSVTCDCRRCASVPAPLFDPALVRTCPHGNCRCLVIDSHITRCPSCWTVLPEAAL
ncbi:hypothetical protein [uncultured Friedmanniella sp.]|uniref:hypothetical protein n=1 Tax=uncultured Friedmanniella sp. TaxID=335381 RepID=UPI0035CA6337